MPAWPVSAQTRLLVVAPHPDDETLGCGLLIQQVLAAGGAVQILLMTDGDNNPWPQRYMERRLRIDRVARERWGLRRRAEVARAIERLDVPAAALHALGWLDMGITGRLLDDPVGSIATMRSIVQQFRPNLVGLPALRDSHPDHGAAHVLCRLAVAGSPSAPVLLAYPVHGEMDEVACPVRIDAVENQQQRKLQALAEHKTQMVLSATRMRRLALSPERFMQVDDAAGDSRLPWRPPAALHRWLQLSVVSAGGVKEWRWSQAPLVREPDGAYRLSWPSGQPQPAPAFVKLHLDWPSPWIFDHWGWHAL